MSNNTEEIKRPICPNCHEKMERPRYTGYYEQFDYWDCNCEYEPPFDYEWKGEYAR